MNKKFSGDSHDPSVKASKQIEILNQEIATLRNREQSHEQVEKRLGQALENLRIHQEELRVQNENLWKIQGELEDSHGKYLDLFESAPIGYFILDSNGHIQEVNLTGSRMLGRERVDLLDTNLSFYLKGDSRDSLAKHLSQIFLGSPTASVEGEVNHPSEKSFFVLLESVPIRDLDNHVLRCRTAVIDITERKQLESQLQHAQKLESLGVLAGGIAHDVNNLLTAITSHAGLALHDINESSPLYDRLTTIEKAALRGGELANQLLAYAGRSQTHMQPHDLSKLVKEMGHLMQVAISRGGALRYELNDSLPPIQADPSQIRQIIINLTTNASESLQGQNGTIQILTGEMSVTQDYLTRCVFVGDMIPGNAVFLEVTDTGTGIHQDNVQKIFDPFFTTKFTGRGLGLAALSGIVRTHGGAVSVSSETGQGTSFRIIFPITSSTVEEDLGRAFPTQTSAEQNNDAFILIVDDDEDIRVAALLVLEQAGFRALTAADGREGLTMFQKHSDEITGVLLDLTMPNLSGEDVFREIRQIRPDIPILISSGYSEEESLARFTGENVQDFIQKPYLIEDLANKFKEMLKPQ